MQGSSSLATTPVLPNFARYKEALKSESVTLDLIVKAINELKREEEITTEEFILFLQKTEEKNLSKKELQEENQFHIKAKKLKAVINKLYIAYNEYTTQLNRVFDNEEPERRVQVKKENLGQIQAAQKKAPFIHAYLKEIELAQNPCKAASEENSFDSEEDEGRMDISLERYSDGGLEEQDSLGRASSLGTLVFQPNRYTL